MFLWSRTALNVLLFSAVLWPSVLQAQSYTASVRGVVTDASQSAIPAAKVRVTNMERNISQTVNTYEAGRYVVTSLLPGEYTLSQSA